MVIKVKIRKTQFLQKNHVNFVEQKKIAIVIPSCITDSELPAHL